MTGYLWLCEKCDGSGNVLEVWEGTHSISTIVRGFNHVYLTYEETKFPAYVAQQCPKCKGRGYWEAA